MEDESSMPGRRTALPSGAARLLSALLFVPGWFLYAIVALITGWAPWLERAGWAVALITLAQRMAPRSSEILRERASYYAQRGETDRQLADLSAIIALAPADPAGYRARGDLYTARGATDAAQADYATALDLERARPVLTAERGYLAYSLKHYAEAFDEFTAYLAAQPTDRRARYHRANAAYFLERYAEAAADYTQCLHVGGEVNWEALRWRAYIYANFLGRRDEALQDYNLALEMRPDAWPLLLERGRLHLALSQYEDVIIDCYRYLKRHPSAPAALCLRGHACQALKHYAEALDDFNAVVRQEPDNAHALASRGSVYVALGRTTLALADLNAALARGADDARALVDRACLLRVWGRYDDALRDSEAAHALAPNDAYVQVHLGICYLDLHRDAAALAAFERALTLESVDQAIAHNGRGVAYAHLGDYAAALADFDRALVLRLDFPHALTNRALVYEHLGRRADADAAFAYVQARYPTHAVTLYNLACQAALRGERTALLTYLRATIAVEPESRFELPTDPHFAAWHADPEFQALQNWPPGAALEERRS